MARTSSSRRSRKPRFLTGTFIWIYHPRVGTVCATQRNQEHLELIGEHQLPQFGLGYDRVVRGYVAISPGVVKVFDPSSWHLNEITPEDVFRTFQEMYPGYTVVDGNE